MAPAQDEHGSMNLADGRVVNIKNHSNVPVHNVHRHHPNASCGAGGPFRHSYGHHHTSARMGGGSVGGSHQSQNNARNHPYHYHNANINNHNAKYQSFSRM